MYSNSKTWNKSWDKKKNGSKKKIYTEKVTRDLGSWLFK